MKNNQISIETFKLKIMILLIKYIKAVHIGFIEITLVI